MIGLIKILAIKVYEYEILYAYLEKKKSPINSREPGTEIRKFLFLRTHGLREGVGRHTGSR